MAANIPVHIRHILKVGHGLSPATFGNRNNNMEFKQHKRKIIHIARLSSLDSRTSRQTMKEPPNLNIFNHSSLQASPITSSDKKYNLVGLSQIQECIKRGKRALNSKKFTHLSAFNLSLKSCTAKSNEADENLLTKEEVYQTLKHKINSNNCQLMINSKSNDVQRKYIQSVMTKTGKKFRIKNNRFSDKLDKYQEKVELLKKYTLHQKKQNIPADEWKKILRSQINLGQIFDKNQRYYETIKRKGFKVVAMSKMKKEIDWIESQKESTLYQLVQKQKNNAAAHPRLKKKDQLVIRI